MIPAPPPGFQIENNPAPPETGSASPPPPPAGFVIEQPAPPSNTRATTGKLLPILSSPTPSKAAPAPPPPPPDGFHVAPPEALAEIATAPNLSPAARLAIIAKWQVKPDSTAEPIETPATSMFPG